MNDNLNITPDTLQSDEGERKANPSYYLDRRSATILMIIKLAEGLSKLFLTILGAVMLQTLVTSLNRIFQQGTTVADGKAMVAQVLKTLMVPPEVIKQIIDAFPLNISFSSGPIVYVFMICLPFVLVAVLEAIGAILLRLGKGGTRMIGILQRIYYVLEVIGLGVLALLAVVLSIVTIVHLGGTAGIALSTIYVSLAVFFILISLPTLLYHRYVARIMDDIGYEMQTGRQAVRKKTLFKPVLTILIALEVIGAIVSIIAFWSPAQGGLAAVMIVLSMIGPVGKLLKYISVKYCYRNFMKEDVEEEMNGSVSHKPQIILIVLVIFFFTVPNIFLWSQSSAFSTAIVEKVEEFFSNARQTVTEVSVQTEEQIQAAQDAIVSQLGIEETAAPAPGGTTEEAAGTATSQEQAAAEGTATPQEQASAEGTASVANAATPAENTETAGSAA